MHHILDSLMAAIQHSSILGYLIIFLIFFLESLAFVGLVIPGTVFLVLSGFMSARDMLDMQTVLVVILSAIIIGDGLSFYLGERGKSFFRAGNKIFKSKYLEKGEDFFRSHGNKSVLFGRFIGPMRPMVAFIAGLFKMDAGKFYFLNITSAALWVTLYFSLGFFFGQAARAIEIWSSRVGIFLLLLAIFFIFFYLVKSFITRRSAAIYLFMKSVSSSIKEAVLENEDVRRVINNNPKFFEFLSKRFERGVFTGLPLTFLTIGFAYVVVLFLGVVEDVLTSDLIVDIDMRVANLFLAFRHASLVRFFLGVTMLGKWQLVLVFSFVTTIILWIWQKRFYIIALWTTISGSMIFAYLGKLAFHRLRPANPVYYEGSFSFPSGHATMASAFFGFLAYFFIKELKTIRGKINAVFINLLMILLIGLSRLYLGVHFFSDVWAGYLLGALWLIIGITFAEWIYFKLGGTMREYVPDLKTKLATAALLIMAIASYLALVISFKPFYSTEGTKKSGQIVESVDSAFKDLKLPKYSETLTGNTQEPLSFIIVAKDNADLIRLFNKAGWLLPEDWSFDLMLRISQAALLNTSYPQAPITPSFWNSQVNDLGFQKPTANNSIKERHHIRFWNTGLKTKDEKSIFVGTASLDEGLKWWIAHRINPDIDTEREYVFNDLLSTGLVSSWKRDKFVEPVLGKNFAGDQFFTDGEIYTIIVR